MICCDNSSITTIEGLGNVNQPHYLQKKFAETYATQCGYCTPGFVMTLYAEILNGKRTEKELRQALDGNLCRCTGYRPINQVLQDIEDTEVVDWKVPEFPDELKQA